MIDCHVASCVRWWQRRNLLHTRHAGKIEPLSWFRYSQLIKFYFLPLGSAHFWNFFWSFAKCASEQDARESEMKYTMCTFIAFFLSFYSFKTLEFMKKEATGPETQQEDKIKPASHKDIQIEPAKCARNVTRDGRSRKKCNKLRGSVEGQVQRWSNILAFCRRLWITLFMCSFHSGEGSLLSICVFRGNFLFHKLMLLVVYWNGFNRLEELFTRYVAAPLRCFTFNTHFLFTCVPDIIDGCL